MSLREESCFAELADAVRRFARGRKIVEIVNSGNWGDALIHAGQAEFLRDNGIEVDQIPISKLKGSHRLKTKMALRLVLRGRRAIITGSGAYRPFYDRASEMASASRRFREVLVMPSSFPFLPDFDAERTILWRRDKLESMEGAPHARFCHDMAFYLNPAPRTPTRTEAFFFRDDAERGSAPIPAGNCDVSNEGTHKTDPERFFDRVGDYEVIHTNRLHAGIAGALLGREVHLYASRTVKLQSIFECSLQPFYPNVHFHPDVADISALAKRAAQTA